MSRGASCKTGSTPVRGRVAIVGFSVAASLALGCGGGSASPSDGGAAGAGGHAGTVGTGGDTGGTASGTPGTAGSGTAGGAGSVATAGTPGVAGAAGGASGPGGLAGAPGSGASGCIQKLTSVYIHFTDGSLGYALDIFHIMPVLDDATGKPLTGVVSVQDSGATGAGCASLTNGTVKCWLTGIGKAAVGQLGNGSTAATTTTFRATPVVTTGGGPLTNIRTMAGGEFGTASCAVTNDGKVYCWGDLAWLAGDGTVSMPTGSAQLLTIDGTNPLTGVEQIALGNRQACALRAGASAKEVWCWGYGASYELGQASTTNLPHPTKVPGLMAPSAVTLSPSYIPSSSTPLADATVCVIETGNVRCWGSNTEGATGIIKKGSTTVPTVQTPTAVVDMNGVVLDGVTAIADGFGSFSALRADGSLWAWGHEQAPFARSIATGVVAIGYGTDTGPFGPFYLTSDGLYHRGNSSVTVTCPSP